MTTFHVPGQRSRVRARPEQSFPRPEAGRGTRCGTRHRPGSSAADTAHLRHAAAGQAGADCHRHGYPRLCAAGWRRAEILRGQRNHLCPAVCAHRQRHRVRQQFRCRADRRQRVARHHPEHAHAARCISRARPICCSSSCPICSSIAPPPTTSCGLPGCRSASWISSVGNAAGRHWFCAMLPPSCK